MNAAVDAPAGRESRAIARDAAALTPSELENLIELWRLVGLKETDRAERRHAFERMRQLIAMRTPKRVREMEKARGLR